MSLLTRCTHCHTVFRLTAEQLQAHDGQVRCGRCMQVFNGLAALVPDVPLPPDATQEPAATQAVSRNIEAAASAPVPPEIPEQTEPMADIVSASDMIETELPEVAASASESTSPDADPLPKIQAAAAPDVTEPGSVAELAAQEPKADSAENPFIQEAFDAVAEPAPKQRWLAAACVLFGFALAAQAIYFYRGEIAARHPLARQWLGAACVQAGCGVPLPRVIKALLIEASDLQLVDPARPQRIQLTATLRNHAGHDVAYPALDLVLTNAYDHTLARRIFLPAEYLGGNRDPSAGIGANAELTVRLVLETGNLGAAGFRLAILPAPLR